MKKIDRLLKSVETKVAVLQQQEAITLDHTAIGERVRPTYAHEPDKPVYEVVGKEFQLEIENGTLYNVAYYQLQDIATGLMHHRLVASYEIVMA